MTTQRMRRLECCCCGGIAPALKQWFNRDTGYGLCGRCARMIQARPDYNVEEFQSYYGDEGVHWFLLGELVYIRFSSHRAREYGFRALNRKPQGFYSWERRLGMGGVYLVTEQDIVDMRQYSAHARFTRLRGPYTDLRECLDA